MLKACEFLKGDDMLKQAARLKAAALAWIEDPANAAEVVRIEDDARIIYGPGVDGEAEMVRAVLAKIGIVITQDQARECFVGERET